MRLLALCEVRSTGDSDAKASRRPSPSRSIEHCWGGGASGDWRWNVQKRVFMNQGDLPRRRKERGRSQSPRSSVEAANPRGAKEGRKVEA
jgi:hypothetical protein